MRLIERVWDGDAAAERLVRAALTPFELAYAGIVGVRNSLYDRGVLGERRFSIPVVSVGNLTVGGTGKTPIAAWVVARMRELGRSPAIVLRGYGNDEPLVHARANPDVPVIVSPDRVAGIEDALARGADVVVLDDAFQHRRAGRTVDIVLISADAWNGAARLLPAGPFREPMSGVKRASMVIITRKAAPDATVAALERAVRAEGAVSVAIASLELGELVREDGGSDRQPVAALKDKSVVAVAAIGNPDAFFAQLRRHTSRVTALAFPDHHAFTESEISDIVRRGRDADYVVCTLKDAVKLGARWPAGARPLWYVSLAVRIERGADSIHELLSRL